MVICQACKRPNSPLRSETHQPTSACKNSDRKTARFLCSPLRTRLIVTREDDDRWALPWVRLVTSSKREK